MFKWGTHIIQLQTVKNNSNITQEVSGIKLTIGIFYSKIANSEAAYLVAEHEHRSKCKIWQDGLDRNEMKLGINLNVLKMFQEQE